MLHYLIPSPPSGDAPAPRSGGGARLGVIVAKRLIKTAVGRNLVKRVARESFRLQRPSLPSCDIILRLSASPPRPLNRQALRVELQDVLTRLTARFRSEPRMRPENRS